MSSPNSSITKQPLKVIEVPLSKFSEEVIPHYQKVFEEYKAHMQTVNVFEVSVA